MSAPDPATEAAQRIAFCLRKGRDHLNLAGLGLTELPPDFAKLTGLRYLDLTGNQLKTLPDDICAFTELRWLGLNFNRLRHLPPYIGNLRELKRLYIRENNLVEQAVGLTECTKLIELDLRGNRLESLDGHWAYLTRLSCLDVSANPLRMLPLALGSLEQLNKVWLSAESLPVDYRTAWGDGDWERLKQHLFDLDKAEMDAYRKQGEAKDRYGDLPDHILSMMMQSLDSCTTFSEHRKALMDVLLATEAVQKRDAKELERALMGPRRSGKTTLAARIWGHQPTKDQLLHTGKLVLIGDTGMGKTCLLRALKGEPFTKESESTQGMEVSRLRLRSDGSLVRPDAKQQDSDITFHCWDMGGQEMYHYTHQIFFSDEAIYLAVIRAGEENRFNVSDLRKWLELLRTRTQREGIHIIVTITECLKKDEIERGALQDDFPSFVFDFIQVDSDGRGRANEDGHQIPELRQKLAALAQGSAGFARGWLPNWVRTMEALTAQAERNYLPLAEAWQLCEKNGISDPGHLLETAHEAGLLLWKRHLGAARDYVLLNPDWLSHAVARILVVADAPEKAANKAIKAGMDVARIIKHAGTQRWTGPVTKEQLSGIWGCQIEPSDRLYTTDEMTMLVELMEAYDISYRGKAVRLDGMAEERFLIAPMVAEARPSDIATYWPTEIPFGQVEAARLITFDLKEGELEVKDYQRIICQLIVRLHLLSLGVDDIAQARHWKSGLLIAHSSGARGYISIGTRELDVRVRGGNPKGLLNIVLDAIGSGENCVVRQAEVVQSVACWNECQPKKIGKGRWPLRVLEQKEAVENSFTCDKGNCTRQLFADRLLHPYAPEAAADQLLHSIKKDTAATREVATGIKEETTLIRADTAAIHQQLSDWPRILELDEEAFSGLFAQQSQQICQHMAQMLLEHGNRFLKEMKTPGADGPRLFSLTPVPGQFLSTSGWTEASFKLTLWCEHSLRPLCVMDGPESTRGIQTVTFQKRFLKKSLPVLKWMVAAGIWVKGAASLTLPEVALTTAAFGAAFLAEVTLLKDLVADLEKAPVLPADHEEGPMDADWSDKFDPKDSQEHGIPIRAMTAFALKARELYPDKTWAGMAYVNGLWVHPRYEDKLMPPKPVFT